MASTNHNNKIGIPADMVRRWARPPISCKACRRGKRRCNRVQPCSNCTLRNMQCEYEGKELESVPEASVAVPHVQSSMPQIPASLDFENVLARIRKLEDAVFKTQSPVPRDEEPVFLNEKSSIHQSLSQDQITASSSVPMTTVADAASTSGWTPIELNVPSAQRAQVRPEDLMGISRHLPPRSQGMELLDHFIRCVQPTFGVLHIPSIIRLVEQTYQSLLEGDELIPANLVLLFSIFSAATLTWTPELLNKVRGTPAAAQAAFANYTDLAISLSEHVSPSTVALEAISLLVHTLTMADGYSEKAHQLSSRAFLMARSMQLHRLDTPRSREARRLEGRNEIEVEVQRRIWWHMAASDWLLAFSGGAQEGTYMFHPRHMNARHPRNLDDEHVTANGELAGLPMSSPTSVSYLIHRLYLAEICREVVDSLPSVLLEPEEVGYDVICKLNARFEDFVKALPVFFQLDPHSIEESREVCEERPYIAWQRTTLNFSINTYVCRLHRPFHLKSSTNSTYAVSRAICNRSAHAVLELRRSMDDIGSSIGLNGLRFWTVAQHVFLAAVTLAAEVSFDPTAPLVDIRKAEVLEVCKMLEAMRTESKLTRETIQKGVQTLLSTLEDRRSSSIGTYARAPVRDGIDPPPSHSTDDFFAGVSSDGVLSDFPEFSSAVPDWDLMQWNSLLEDIDWTIGSVI